MSLKKRLKNFMSYDWQHEDSSYHFPLKKYYVQLEWTRKIRTPVGTRRRSVASIHDLIKSVHNDEEYSSILITGKIVNTMPGYGCPLSKK